MTNLFKLTPAETARIVARGEAAVDQASKEFSAQLSGDVDRLVAATETDDLATARRLAYDLSGLAGSLGHPNLGSAARCLHFALETPQRPLAEDAVIRVHIGAIRRIAGFGEEADGRLLVEALYALLEHRGRLPLFHPVANAS